MLAKIKNNWKKFVVLFLIGLIISLFIGHNLRLSGAVFFSDMFFIIAMTYFLCGLMGLVGNIGFFNSFKFGAKCLYRLVRSKLGASNKLKEEYIEYIKSRPKTEDVSILMLIGFGMFLLSVLFSFFISQ